jgi:formamidopyrimidine-DNA glycosylase
MPELPEVETLRRQLEKEVIKKTVADLEAKSSRVLKRLRPQSLSKELLKKTIEQVTRKGKYIIIGFNNSLCLAIHLGMSGQILYTPKKSTRGKNNPPEEKIPHLYLTMRFTDGSALRYVDPRTFGQILLLKDLAELQELTELGFDPLEAAIPWVEFASYLVNQKSSLKAILTNQSFIAGIGNIYADEILFAAGLRPDRDPKSLSTQEIRRLYRSIGEVLTEAVKHRGSTLADKSYVDIYGNYGEYQQYHNVYAREAMSCKRCRGTVQKIKYQGRSTYFCPLCQR